MKEHYWESVWVNKGYFVCKICVLRPQHCQGKIRIGKLNDM